MSKERLKLPFPSVGPSTDKVLFFPVEFFFFTFFSFSFFVDTTKAQELSNTYAALPVSRRRAAGPGDDEGREYCCSRSKKSSSPSSFVFYPLDLHLDLDDRASFRSSPRSPLLHRIGGAGARRYAFC